MNRARDKLIGVVRPPVRRGIERARGRRIDSINILGRFRLERAAVVALPRLLLQRRRPEPVAPGINHRRRDALAHRVLRHNKVIPAVKNNARLRRATRNRHMVQADVISIPVGISKTHITRRTRQRKGSKRLGPRRKLAMTNIGNQRGAPNPAIHRLFNNKTGRCNPLRRGNSPQRKRQLRRRAIQRQGQRAISRIKQGIPFSRRVCNVARPAGLRRPIHGIARRIFIRQRNGRQNHHRHPQHAKRPDSQPKNYRSHRLRLLGFKRLSMPQPATAPL